MAVIASLSGCAAASPDAASSPSAAPARPASTDPSAAAARSSDPVRSVAAASAFTVAGDRRVQPNGSQDTHAATPTARCSSSKLTGNKALGGKVAAGFGLAGFSASADLLRHFLAGTGIPIDYRAGSPLSRQARASSPFRALNGELQHAVLGQLNAGETRVELSPAQLPLLAFDSTTSDLYWGFRGTQGLTVTGRGSGEHGRYVGTLTYVIRDSYGFPASDTLGGFGAPMRYLQTVCGAPQHPGGAHWFPDAITVTVPFNRRAGRE